MLRTFTSSLEQRVHSGQHRFSTLQAISLQIGKLCLHKLVKDLALGQQFVYPELLVCRGGLGRDLGLEQM